MMRVSLDSTPHTTTEQQAARSQTLGVTFRRYRRYFVYSKYFSGCERCRAPDWTSTVKNTLVADWFRREDREQIQWK